MRPLALLLLAAAPGAAQVTVNLRALPPAAVEPAAIDGMTMALAPIVLARPTEPEDDPDMTVQLGDIFNRNWKADSYDTGEGKVWLGTHFDQQGNAYLSVIPPHAMVPTLFKYEKGMKGSWQVGRETYEVSLEINIFRAKTNNFVVVKKRSDGEEVYRARIREVLLKTFPLGQDVKVGGRGYRLFFSHGVLGGKPAHIDTQTYTLVFVVNAAQDGDLDFHSYIIAFKDLEGGALVTYQLYDGAKVRLRALKDQGELQLYLP